MNISKLILIILRFFNLECFRFYNSNSSGAWWVRIIPDFHIQIDAFFKWIVIFESFIRRLYRFHRSFDTPSLKIINFNWNTARSKIASCIRSLISILQYLRWRYKIGLLLIAINLDEATNAIKLLIQYKVFNLNPN